jgi:hypothetical protein
MTTASLTRTFGAQASVGAATGLGTALLAAAALSLLGHPALSLLPMGALLLWGVAEAGSPTRQRRLIGQASALIALGGVLQGSVPRFLSPASDYLLLVTLTAVPLLAVAAGAPTARRALSLRRPRPTDFLWLVLGFAVARGVVVGTVHGGPNTATSELLALTVLVVLLPVVNEAIYRGLLMRATGDSTLAVVGVAVIQGLAVVPALGLAGLVGVTVLGMVLGFVRRTTGSWQTSLSAHWGIALGLAAPILMTTGVGS